MERLLRKVRPPTGNCRAIRMSEDARASLTGTLWPPGMLTNTVATAAKPSPKPKTLVNKNKSLKKRMDECVRLYDKEKKGDGR